jgi:hypothetical protein
MSAMSNSERSVGPKLGLVLARDPSSSLRVRRAPSAGICVLVPRSGEAMVEK